MRDHYTACKIESPFPCQQVPPFDEWRTQSELDDSIENVFENIREEYVSNKRKREGHADREEEGLLFWCTDIHEVYEKLLDLQFFHKGTEKCVDVDRRYGSDMYSICGLLIEGKGLQKIRVKNVPHDCEQLNHLSKNITQHLNMNKKRFIYMGRIIECVDRKPSLAGMQNRPGSFDKRGKGQDIDKVQSLLCQVRGKVGQV